MKNIKLLVTTLVLFVGGLLSIAPLTQAIADAAVYINVNPVALNVVVLVGATAFYCIKYANGNYSTIKQSGTIIERWAPYIVERFFKDNTFLKFAKDDSGSILQGRVVYIPQIGAKPAVVKNRSSFPATAVRRSDTDVLYSLDHYSTDPTHIPNIDKVHLSYSKQDSVLGDHMTVINESVADDMLNKWGANATVVPTTGAAIGPITGQTGNRKGFTEADLKNLMIKMNADNVPKQGRYVMIDDNMFGFFYDSLGQTNAKDFSQYMDAANGVIGRLHGFSVMTRSSVLALSSANAIKALGSSLAATDNLASLAWQKDTVTFAMGDKTLFQDLNNPLYYGDVHSVEMWAGGRVVRGDGKGIYAITQAASA